MKKCGKYVIIEELVEAEGKHVFDIVVWPLAKNLFPTILTLFKKYFKNLNFSFQKIFNF